MKYKFTILHILLFFFIQNTFAQEKLFQQYNLMPWPNEIHENGESYIINTSFTISIKGQDNNRIQKFIPKFIKRLSEKTGVFISQNKALTNTDSIKPSLLIEFDRKGKLVLNEDESYNLDVYKEQIHLQASTDIGILRGLATLLQLVDNTSDYYYFSGVSIKDKPRFPWRGLMIDVARHYEPMQVLKRNLDAMAAVKLNVFHWHLTDDQGFRVEVKSYPKLHQLGSNGEYYTQDEITELVSYASDLGIRVIPEFDVPAHATSWLTAYPEIGSKKNTHYSVEINSGIFNPTLDPTNSETYKVIEGVFTEMATLFPDAYFHIGGDENAGKDWDSSAKIQDFKKKNYLKTNHELQTYFNIKIQEILQKNHKIMMGWDEIFQPNLPKDVVIHSWRGKKAMVEAAKQGYKTVLSEGYYIDLLEPTSRHYLNDPILTNNNLTTEQIKNILGGEATMWGELVTPLTIDSRIWPRTAAIAERLWSNATVNDVDNMYKRLAVISHELERLGLTHLKNKEVILRNITDNQDISSLKDLMNVCEPIKGYVRNEKGTEYKTFSPFTLFADACTADAPDALFFNHHTNLFLKTKDDDDAMNCIKKSLLKWKDNYSKLQQIDSNPKIKPLEPLSKNLAEITTRLLTTFHTKQVTSKQLTKMKLIIEKLKKPYTDVELVIVDSLEKLIQYSENTYLSN